MHRERPPEHRRRFAMAAERHVAEPGARERAEVVPIARERLLAIGDRALVVLGDVADRRPLVQALGEFRRLSDHAGEDILGSGQIAALHGRDALTKQRVDLTVARAMPHLPQRRLRAGRRVGVVSAQCLQSIVLGHGAPSLRRVGAKSKMAPDMARFTGKVVLITGGAGGIGRATAVRFASEGARVVVVDLAAAALRQSVAAVEKVDGEVHAVEADVTRAADVERYAAAAVERFGGIDVFFNNAGVLGALRPLVDYPEETFDRVIAVNLKAVWLGMKAIAPRLRARGGGAIVNTASVVGMTRAASLELARHNIRVNAVCPAPIETPMAQELETEIKRERLTATIPMRRYGEPPEVASLVAFLASSDAAYITGAIYTVDGGAMA